MCGIAGAYGAGGLEPDRHVVEAVVLDQVRRGPDFQATAAFGTPDGYAVLGHDRLSIVDLSPNGHQPMSSACGRYHLVYNGEIYNFLELRAELVALGETFRTGSDTEVLLTSFQRWGTAAIERWNGMFALGLYDRTAHRLWLVRDRFGVKPLFYVVRNGRLYFASSGRVLARRLGLVPDLEYVARGLRYSVYEDDEGLSPYAGLQAVPAGHFIDATADVSISAKAMRYYDLAGRASQLHDELRNIAPGELQERFCALLDDAVAIRLRADVPVGVSISGGLDSSSIAALAAARLPRLAGFCYGAPGEPSSEGPLVGLVAERTGLEGHYSWFTGGTEVIDAFWATLDAQDAPFLTGSLVAQFGVFRAARAAGYKVLLGGQGGDEALMGYNKYRWFQLHGCLDQGRFASALQIGAGMLPTLVATRGQLSALWAQRARYRRSAGLRHRLQLPTPRPVSLGTARGEPLWRRQLLDVLRTSLPTLLRYEDRNSMGNSIESRLPFLDFRVMEFGLGLPDEMKLCHGWGKWILRSAMRGRLPDAIRMNRAKRGFDANERDWFPAGLGHAIRERLHAAVGILRPFLPVSGTIDTLYSDQALAQPGRAFGEAISLLWLGERM